MRKLSFLILLFTIKIIFAQQSPHGANFNYDCQDCHTTDTWKIESSKLNFEHAQTGFELLGQHKVIDCQSCHSGWAFPNTSKDCYQCHTDIHNNTVSKSCDNCHSSKSWVIENINDVHRMSRFPLVGAHTQADCQNCHKSINNLQFEQLGVDCIDCHISDYESATSPNHREANFSTDCQECHQITDQLWSSANFEHNFFPLEGGHNIGNCFDCHNTNNFEGLSQDCIVCHQADFNATTNPSHSNLNFSQDCLECHTTNPGWRPAEFKLHDNFYPLLGAHKIIANDCTQCHTTTYENTPTDCFSCHKNEYDNTSNPNHSGAGFSTDCETCHNLDVWLPATFDHDNQFFPIYSGEHNNEWNDCSDCHTNPSNYQVFECINCHEHNQTDMDDEHSGINGYSYQSTACLACHPTGSEDDGFSHSTTEFPLTGAHVTADCSDCHTAGYTNMDMECVACHENDYSSSVDPNHSTAGISTRCEDCHTSTAWQPSEFNHSTTGFELAGGHNLPQCSSCHTGNTTDATSDCYSCHSAEYTSAEEHVSQNYPQECQQCHNTTNWEDAIFDHAATQFPLTGAHVSVDCSTCHTNGYAGTASECFACHSDEYTSAEEHVSQNYPQECQQCHNTSNWEDATFDHAATQFPLTGAHVSVDCSTCHTDGYAGTATECFACHETEYTSAATPDHSSAGVSTTCEDCHTSTAWQPSEFNHSTTGFELAGGHNLPQCSSCHIGNTSDAISDCYSCHLAEYTSAEEHVSQNYPQECQQCHNTSNWEDATFDHAASQFPLTGAHVSVDCSTCHTDGYVGTSTKCFACHETDYISSATPDHSSAGVATTCEDCHSTSAWQPSTFSHSATGFELAGGHNLPQCSSCHTGNTSDAISDCYSCHSAEYTTAPEHVSQNYPQECQQCHNTTNWQDATFDHTTTQFPLTGAHVSLDCSTCHTNGYAGTATECFACHETNYTSSSTPDHSTAGVATTCEDCHTSNAWQPSTFNHSGTGFELAGGHNLPQCSSCHTGSTSNASSDCYSCHQTEYNNTTNPAHQSSGFGTQCQDCHQTTAWTPATFDHDGQYFPIYSGKHQGEWNDCSDCHTNASDFSQFSCLTCHEHNQTDMDDDHSEVNDYSYNSSACLDCHPTGDDNALQNFHPKILR